MLLESFDTLWQRAKEAWQKDLTQNRRVVLLHALPALGLPFIVMVINLLLEGQFAGTGGLSGIGMRSTLETIQTVLVGAIRIALPFWQLGLVFNAIKICRGEESQPQHLLVGFQKWGGVLRLMLLRTIRYTSKIVIGLFLGSLLYSLTPLSSNIAKLTEELVNDPTFANATYEELMAALYSRLNFWDIFLCYGLCGVVIGVLTVPLFYHYRLSDYILLDSEKPGALQALQESTIRMRGNCINLFKVDLHFWWYYLLLFLATLTSYGDLILPALGISLPISWEWAYVLFGLFSTVLQFILYYLFRGQVEITYACIYEASIPSKEVENSND